MSAATVETFTPEIGLYADLDNDTYHEQTDWVSSSMLKRLMPEHYKAGGSQEALDFGTLFHTAVLEPDNLATYEPLDAAAIGVKSDGTAAQNPLMTVAWKRAVAEAEAHGKKVIAQTDLDRALAMRDAILAHDTAPRLLFADDRHVEESAFAVVNDVPCRARFDVRLPSAVVDLKSTSAKPGARSLRYAVRDYGYHLSAHHYLTVARELGLTADTFALVFVSKTEPHYVTVAELGPDLLADGEDHWHEAIRRHTDPTADAYEGARGYITL